MPLALFLLVHLFANRLQVLGWVWHGRFLSFAGGVSFAYVFVDLLPALGEGQPILKQTFEGVLPFLDRHAYVIALLGVLFYYGLQGSTSVPTEKNFWFSIFGYQLFNGFVGASLADPSNPDVQPLVLFTIAVGLHYFIHDHTLREQYPVLYEKYGRWCLASALVIGYLIGYFTQIPDSVVAVVIAFVGGGMLLNVLHYELPNRGGGGYPYFVLGALIYTAILLRVGVQ